MGIDTVFGDLRRLADWFAGPSGNRTSGRTQTQAQIERVVHRLGATGVPLLGRELCHGDPRRRDCARAALAHLATTPARPRVIAELRQIAASAAADEGKVCALGLLAELGERGAARFSDPTAIQRRSALALATQLESAADVAAAADLMIKQLAHEDMLQLVAVMTEAAPPAAQRLAAELCVRLDLPGDLRERINELVFGADVDATEAVPQAPVRAPRPTHVAILVDAAARLVVVASRKLPGERRWRRFAVLIDREGRIDDCLHDDAPEDHAPLVANLVADGYRVASSDLERARGIVAAAARASSDAEPAGLSSAYYLGRDLLELGDAHLGGRVHAHPTSSTLGRAIELLADGEPARAQLLLGRVKTDSADLAAAEAACLLATNKLPEALAPLQRAADLEPSFPLHHWNLAAALHQLGDRDAELAALRRFLATSTQSCGLAGDPDHPARVGLAHRLIRELERTARLARAPRRRKRATSSKSQKKL
jgi:tetratricopeptide (TPR) repeat protein